MAVNAYALGALVGLKAIFTDADGNLVDPDTVTIKYRPPGLAVVTVVYGTDAALVKLSTGTYRVRVDTSVAHGIWRAGVRSTGNGQAAFEIQFTVLPSALD